MANLVWKRLCYGESKETAEDVLEWARRDGTTAKISKGKMGYSVLIKDPSFKQKL